MTEFINNIYDLGCTSKEVWRSMGETLTVFSFLAGMAALVCYAFYYADKIAAIAYWIISRLTNN